MDGQENIHEEHLPNEDQREEVEERFETFLRSHHVPHDFIPIVANHANENAEG